MAASEQELLKVLGTMYDEVQRIMFNLEVRRKRLINFSRNAEDNSLYLKRIIRNLIELGQLVDAKRETRNFVENTYEMMSMNVVAKKLATVLALLKEKLKKPSQIDSFLIIFLKKADKAIRGNDLKDMDVRLTKLKRYLQPEVFEEDLSDVKEFLHASQENEVNRIYNEIYDEVNLVHSLSGLNSRPIVTNVEIPEFKTAPKKNKMSGKFGLR